VNYWQESWNHARQTSGLARFERESTRQVWVEARRVRAYRVHGEPEHERWRLLQRRAQELYGNRRLDG
jgi:hypothetical protein